MATAAAITLTSEQFRELFTRMAGQEPPRGLNPATALVRLRQVHPLRFDFEVGRLLEPSRNFDHGEITLTTTTVDIRPVDPDLEQRLRTVAAKRLDDDMTAAISGGLKASAEESRIDPEGSSQRATTDQTS